MPHRGLDGFIPQHVETKARKPGGGDVLYVSQKPQVLYACECMYSIDRETPPETTLS